MVKPWDNAKLLETLQAAYQIRSANHKGGVGNKQLVSKESGMFWGDSNAMQQLRMLIEKVAKTDANILITERTEPVRKCWPGKYTCYPPQG